MWTEEKKQPISQVRIRIPDDNGKPDITGCCFMSDSKAVLCDYYNYQIKILDTSWRLISNRGSHVVSVKIYCTEKWRTSFHTDVLSKSK